VRTLLITGATDGLGRALAARAHDEGWTVLAHGRSGEKLAALADELPGLRTLRADLAELAQVSALADAVGAATDRLDALVSNAGVGTAQPGGGERMESADGHELRFAVNYLAGYALIRRLLPLLRASAPARIVQVSSAGQMPIDFDDVMLERGYDATRGPLRLGHSPPDVAEA
jgi:NAD(P)-dependent dehydrogenase (short-subunit alcohol dehydrogenase family)